MNRTLFTAICFAMATAAQAGTAAALDIGRARPIGVDGLPPDIGSLGALTLTSLGVNGAFCDYLAAWHNSVNPNDAVQCVLHETRTGFAPNCIVNETVDLISAVRAGDVAVGVEQTAVGTCVGFDLQAQLADHVSLALGENNLGLHGLAILALGAQRAVYPVRID